MVPISRFNPRHNFLYVPIQDLDFQGLLWRFFLCSVVCGDIKLFFLLMSVELLTIKLFKPSFYVSSKGQINVSFII